eukprot:3682787-Amphidinium_carterae.1
MGNPPMPEHLLSKDRLDAVFEGPSEAVREAEQLRPKAGVGKCPNMNQFSESQNIEKTPRQRSGTWDGPGVAVLPTRTGAFVNMFCAFWKVHRRIFVRVQDVSVEESHAAEVTDRFMKMRQGSVPTMMSKSTTMRQGSWMKEVL